jgi:hypothetical protein
MIGNMNTATPEERATLLLKEQWCGYPVDPFLIAAREGITVRTTYTLPDDVAGVIAREHATGLMFPTTWVQRFTNLYADGIFVSAPVEQPSRTVSSNMTVTPQG